MQKKSEFKCGSAVAGGMIFFNRPKASFAWDDKGNEGIETWTHNRSILDICCCNMAGSSYRHEDSRVITSFWGKTRALETCPRRTCRDS